MTISLRPCSQRSSSRRMPGVCGILALLFLALVRLVNAASYAVIDLGTLGGRYSTATGISASGHVTGVAETASGYGHAFLWKAGVMVDLGTLSGRHSVARGLNDAGQVVGTSVGPTADDAFYFNGVTMSTLPKFDGNPSTAATAINDAGQIVGWAYAAGGEPRAFLDSSGVMVDLGTLGGKASQAWAINASGAVVGQSTLVDGSSRAFVRPPGGLLLDLGTLGGSFQGHVESAAYGINAMGRVVGASTTAAGVHAFCTSPYRTINPSTDDLGTLGGPESHANGINTAGQIVGAAATAANETHAFVYGNGAMGDLNTMIPRRAGWLLQSALSINDGGQIVGEGYHHGVQRAYLLIPGGQGAPP